MAIHFHKGLQKLLRAQPCSGRSGERGARHTNSQFKFQNLMAPQKGNPLLANTKVAAWSGLTGSRLSVTKLRLLIYVAALSCPPGASRPLRRSFLGPLGCDHLQPETQVCNPKCIPRMLSLPARAIGVAASLQPGQASVPPLRVLLSQRAAPLALYCSVFRGPVTTCLSRCTFISLSNTTPS